MNLILDEIKHLVNCAKKLDKKILVIFLSVGVLQTISWYFTSRMFFRKNLLGLMEDNPDKFLIEYVFWFLGDFITYFILPVIIILFLKENPLNYGLRLGDKKKGFRISGIVLFVMIPLLWFVSGNSEFANHYPQLQSAQHNSYHFFVFEITMLVYMVSWEFIWRGFMQFGLEKKFGIYAILIQMIPFVILHNGKPVFETFSAIIGGILLGYLAYRTRSIWYGVIIHSGIMISMDVFSVIRYSSLNMEASHNFLINNKILLAQVKNCLYF